MGKPVVIVECTCLTCSRAERSCKAVLRAITGQPFVPWYARSDEPELHFETQQEAEDYSAKEGK